MFVEILISLFCLSIKRKCSVQVSWKNATNGGHCTSVTSVRMCQRNQVLLSSYISQFCILTCITPSKSNIEPENHPVEKENHLPNLHVLGSMLVFRGVIEH